MGCAQLRVFLLTEADRKNSFTGGSYAQLTCVLIRCNFMVVQFWEITITWGMCCCKSDMS